MSVYVNCGCQDPADELVCQAQDGMTFMWKREHKFELRQQDPKG